MHFSFIEKSLLVNPMLIIQRYKCEFSVGQGAIGRKLTREVKS